MPYHSPHLLTIALLESLTHIYCACKKGRKKEVLLEMHDQSVRMPDLCRRACIIVQIYSNQKEQGGGQAEIGVWTIHHSIMLLKSDH